MSARRVAALGAPIAAALLVCGVALAGKGFTDPPGDVRDGNGPDVVALRLSSTKTMVTFTVRFAKAPPLRVSTREQWVDMLLIGIDTPPLGPRPIPDGEWRGANFALGTHGPSKTGLLVKLAGGGQRQIARFPIAVEGSTLTFSVSRRALGNPAWLRLMVAAARETSTESAGGGYDTAPDRGTFRYALNA
jgi:hypothetical protein